MLALAGWIVYKTGLDGISFTLASKSLSAGEQTWQMITATAPGRLLLLRAAA